MATFRVTWTIDIDAVSVLEAAYKASEIQKNASYTAAFDVLEIGGNAPSVAIDLGDMVKLFKPSKVKTPVNPMVALRRKYDRNENNNQHSENAVLLARHFGTPDELETANRLLAERNKLGHAPAESSQFQYDMSRKYYSKLVK